MIIEPLGFKTLFAAKHKYKALIKERFNEQGSPSSFRF